MTNSFDMAGTEFTTQGLACGMYVALARYVLHQCCEIRTISFYFLAIFFDFPLYTYPALIVSLFACLYVSLYLSVSQFLSPSFSLFLTLYLTHSVSLSFYPTLSLNHSCVPNVQQTHVPATGEEVLYASRDIEIGEIFKK